MRRTTIDPLVLHFFYKELDEMEKDANIKLLTTGLNKGWAAVKGGVAAVPRAYNAAGNAIVNASPTFAGHMASGNVVGAASDAFKGVGHMAAQQGNRAMRTARPIGGASGALRAEAEGRTNVGALFGRTLRTAGEQTARLSPTLGNAGVGVASAMF